MAGIGRAGWHEMGMRLLGELNGYLRSRFVDQKFVTYSKPKGPDNRRRSHGVREGEDSYRQDLRPQSDRGGYLLPGDGTCGVR
jgi:hypothetical protein